MTRSIFALILLAFCTQAHAADKAQDYLLNCAFADNKSVCDDQKQQFIKWFPKAYRRDYQGQRNVAFCLHTGCDGSVKKVPTLACAWRMVIHATNIVKFDDIDASSLRAACNKLSPQEFEVAKSQLDAIVRNMR